MKRHILRMLAFGACLAAPGLTEACKVANNGTPSGATKDSGAGSNDDDKPDAAVPVAGAYLTCVTSKGNDFVAGCQLRDANKKPIELKNFGAYKWNFLPPKSAPTNPAPKIQIYDLASAKGKKYYFPVAFRMSAPPSTTQPGGKASLALSDAIRKQYAAYFLSIKPVFLRPVAAKNPSSGGLRLNQEQVVYTAPHELFSFGELETKAQTNTVFRIPNAAQLIQSPAGPLATVDSSGAPVPGDATVFDPFSTASVAGTLTQNQPPLTTVTVDVGNQNNASGAKDNTVVQDEPQRPDQWDKVPAVSDITNSDPVPVKSCEQALPELAQKVTSKELTGEDFVLECQKACPLKTLEECHSAAPVEESGTPGTGS